MNKHAYHFGQQVAHVFKRLYTNIKRWERICTDKARKNRLPAWAGKIPLRFLIICISLLILVAGAIVLMVTILFWAFLLLVPALRYAAVYALSQTNDDVVKGPKRKYYSDGSDGSNGSSGS